MQVMISSSDPFFPATLRHVLNPHAAHLRQLAEREGREYVMTEPPFDAYLQWHRDCLQRNPPAMGAPEDLGNVQLALAAAEGRAAVA